MAANEFRVGACVQLRERLFTLLAKQRSLSTTTRLGEVGQTSQGNQGDTDGWRDKIGMESGNTKHLQSIALYGHNKITTSCIKQMGHKKYMPMVFVMCMFL